MSEPLEKKTSDNLKHEDIIKLATKEGRYQDVEVDGKLVIKGWRECSKRWDLIKPHIKNQQTVIDIGSHYGYFTTKIAREYPSTLVWSIESGDDRIAVQEAQVRANKLRNVVLTQRRMGQLDLTHLARTCETATMIICLSMIQYFPKWEIPEILYAFSKIANNLIIEFPNTNEKKVAATMQGLNYKLLLDTFYDTVKILGKAKSPKHDDVSRTLYLCQNFKIEKDHVSASMYALSKRSHKVIYKAGGWKIDGKRKEHNGLNLGNLLMLGTKYPTEQEALERVATNYYHLVQDNKGKVTDINPFNVIRTHYGYQPIDYKEGIGKDLYTLKWKDYVKKNLKVDQKWWVESLIKKLKSVRKAWDL